MTIRDDRGCMRRREPGYPSGVTLAARRSDPEHFTPGFVLHDCPDCHRSHFVTVDSCPNEAEAAAETARVDRRAA